MKIQILSETNFMVNISAKEQEVLGLYNKGYSRKQAAQKLDVSEHTYAWHLRQIREKFKIRSRKEMLELEDRLKEVWSNSVTIQGQLWDTKP